MKISQEEKFISKVDCKFPFQDNEKIKQLINEAVNISANCVFFLIEEVCRPPQSLPSHITKEYQLELIEEINNRFNHLLKNIIVH